MLILKITLRKQDSPDNNIDQVLHRNFLEMLIKLIHSSNGVIRTKYARAHCNVSYCCNMFTLRDRAITTSRLAGGLRR